MKLGFLDILKVFTIFQIFLVVIFLLRNTNRRSKTNLLLSILILTKAFVILDGLFIRHWVETVKITPNLIGLGMGFGFLTGPLFYLLIIEITRRKTSFNYKHLLHFIPFVLFLGFILSQFQFQDYATKIFLLENRFPYAANWVKLADISMYFHFAIYAILSLLELSRSRENIYEEFSQSIERNIFYLKFIAYDYLIVWGLNTFEWYVSYGQFFSYALRVITTLNIFVIANTIVYQGLKFPKLFKDDSPKKPKYEKNALTDSEKEEYIKKLKEYMDAHKPYLSPTLSLSDLANGLGMPSFALSQVLNLKAGQNFYEFINTYRIEESKRLLTQSSQNSKTILEILYQCGFNSKSVFNSAFKKYTGMTPSEFKKFTSYQLQQETI